MVSEALDFLKNHFQTKSFHEKRPEHRMKLRLTTRPIQMKQREILEVICVSHCRESLPARIDQ